MKARSIASYVRYTYHGFLTSEEEQGAQQLLEALPVSLVQDPRVRGRARLIAQGFNQDRVYDATYAALAEFMGCEFWTADREFYEAVRSGLDYVKFLGSGP